PLAIIIALGSVTWVYTHLLDPFRPLDRLAEGQPVTAADKPLEVEVVALDWKWLFIYPEQKVASVNELALPTGRPVHFRLTSATVMNSFFVPAIAGQIYAMPGMASQLNAVVNKPGTFRGFSANYSGAGFSQMHFNTLGLEPAAFDKWVADTKAAGGNLDAATYLKLAEPTIAEPVHHFGAVSADLFDKVVNLCVEPGKMCVNQMAMLDARGGTGKAGLFNLAQLTYDKDGRPNLTPLTAARQAQLDQRLNKAFVAALCATGPAPLAAKAPKLTLSQPAPSPLS
ncbi:MAG TPA: COX aromatic rich motif-containing protein, partial [Novosphingobium sp.]|nr:COX aromatic rich motif-containing protein [Novosphingobium sp.]